MGPFFCYSPLVTRAVRHGGWRIDGFSDYHHRAVDQLQLPEAARAGLVPHHRVADNLPQSDLEPNQRLLRRQESEQLLQDIQILDFKTFIIVLFELFVQYLFVYIIKCMKRKHTSTELSIKNRRVITELSGIRSFNLVTDFGSTSDEGSGSTLDAARLLFAWNERNICRY